MLALVFEFLRQTWWLTAEMAPYLLLGFLLAGMLRIFFTEDWVRRHLGQKGLYQIFKAVVIGVPLPLCSCGVIPVAAGIRRQGGQRGAVAAFTAATPQTGVDAIAATTGMLGWVFAIVRVVIAFINGIVAGLIVEKWGDKEEGAPEVESKPSCCSGRAAPPEPVKEAETAACCSQKQPVKACCSAAESKQPSRDFLEQILSGLRFGLITLPRDLFTALVLGLLLAGLLSTFAPENLFTSLPGGQVGVYIGMTLLSLPLYICSTGSIPMAYTFLAAGMSPGAVLIFLIAGPASNTATVTALWKIIGPRSTIGYILSIIATAWIVAIFIDMSGISLLVKAAVHQHEMGISLFQHIMGGILVLVLLASQLGKFGKH